MRFFDRSVLLRRAFFAGVRWGPERFVRHSPRLIGALLGQLRRSQRKNVERNLRRSRGDCSWVIHGLQTSEVFANFASSMTESMLLATPRDYVLKTEALGAEHFFQAKEEGRGVILATAETSGWDCAGALVPEANATVMVVMEPEAGAFAGEMHDAWRRKSGVEIVHVGNDVLSAMPLLRHLRNEKVVALKFDRLPRRQVKTRAVTMFGERFEFPEGPLRLAAVSGAPLVPVFTRRLGFMHYEVTNTPPIRLGRRPSEAQLDAAAQELAQRLESFARLHPTHWLRFGDG
jgi:phosphatidylinositol dimannoside acyltransferase